MSADAGSLHTICRVLFWVFRFDQILVIALYFALHFDQIPSCTQYRRNLFYFQASNGFQPFFNTDQLSWRPSFSYSLRGCIIPAIPDFPSPANIYAGIKGQSCQQKQSPHSRISSFTKRQAFQTLLTKTQIHSHPPCPPSMTTLPCQPLP